MLPIYWFFDKIGARPGFSNVSQRGFDLSFLDFILPLPRSGPENLFRSFRLARARLNTLGNLQTKVAVTPFLRTLAFASFLARFALRATFPPCTLPQPPWVYLPPPAYIAPPCAPIL